MEPRQRLFRVVGILDNGTREILVGGMLETAANAVRDALVNSDIYGGSEACREIVVEPDDPPDGEFSD